MRRYRALLLGCLVVSLVCLLGPQDTSAAPSLRALERAFQKQSVPQRMAQAKALAASAHSARSLGVMYMLLKDPRWRIRDVAVKALTRMGPKLTPKLQKGLFHPHPRVRLHVAQVLGTFGQRAKAAEQSLQRAMSDREWGVRVAVASALATLKSISSIPYYIKAIRDRYWRVRAIGAKALGPFVYKRRILLPYLLGGTQDKHEAVRYASTVSLQALAPDRRTDRLLIKVFIKLLQDPSWRVRWAGADALGKWGSRAKAAVPALRQAFYDKTRKLRIKAALTLGHIGRPAKQMIPVMIAMLQKDDIMHYAVKHMWNPLTRLSAALRMKDRLPYLRRLFSLTRALTNYGSLALRPIEKVLKRPAKMPNPWLLFTLGCLGTKAARSIPIVRRAARHRQVEIRWVAILVLSRIAARSGRARKTLWRARKDTHSLVRLAAAQALAEVKDKRFLQSKAYQTLRQDQSRERQAAKNFLALMKTNSLEPALLWK